MEQRYLNECPSEFKPVLYRRYVDDTICLSRSRSDIEKLLDHINSYHPNIIFTVEIEMDDTLPFLDVSVTHDQNNFLTSLYRKNTFTGLYTDFGTFSPNKYKVNLIRVLVYRAFHICSTYSNFHAEGARIKGILKESCFPLPLIDRVNKTFLGKHFSKKPPPAREEKQFLMFCLPFLGSYSLQIKTKLTRLFKQCYPDVKLKVIFNSPKGLSSHFRFKDRFPILMCSSVVYSYKCPGCHALYYGKTTRNLDTRCREHLGINKAGQKSIADKSFLLSKDPVGLTVTLWSDHSFS